MTPPIKLSSAQGQGGTILAFMLLVLLGLSLAYTQSVYPLQGVFSNAALLLAAAGALAIGWREWGRADGIALYWLAFAPFWLYVFIRFFFNPVPDLGTDFPATVILAAWVLAIALTSARLDINNMALAQAGSQPPDERDEPPPPPPINLDNVHHITVPRMMTAMLALAALALSLYAVYQYFIGYAQSRALIAEGQLAFPSDDIRQGVAYALMERRVAATFGNPNIFAAFLAFTLPSSLGLALGGRRLITKSIGAGCLIATGAALLMTGSRGGLLTALFAAALFLALMWFSSKKSNPKTQVSNAVKIVLFVLVAAVFLLRSEAVPAADPPSSVSESFIPEAEAQNTFFERLFIGSTVKQRFYYWGIGWEIARGNLLFGAGEGMYANLYTHHKPPDAGETRYAHSFAVQLLAEEGLAGLALYLIFPILALALGWRHAMLCPRGPTRTSMLGLWALVAAFHVNGLIEYSFYVRELFLITMAACGVLLGFKPAAAARVAGASGSRRRILILAAAPLFLVTLAAGWMWIPGPMLVRYHLQWGDWMMGEAPPRLADARDHYRKAYSLAPAHSGVLFRLAAIAGHEGKITDEKSWLERAIAANPYSASLHSQMAQWQLDKSAPRDALASISAAIERYPSNARYHYQKAVILKRLKRDGEARAEFERSVALGARDSGFQEMLKRQTEFDL